MENNNETRKLNPLELCDAMRNVLDKIVDSSGRQKCGYIWVMNNLIENMSSAVTELMKESEVNIELVPPEEAESSN